MIPCFFLSFLSRAWWFHYHFLRLLQYLVAHSSTISRLLMSKCWEMIGEKSRVTVPMPMYILRLNSGSCLFFSLLCQTGTYLLIQANRSTPYMYVLCIAKNRHHFFSKHQFLKMNCQMFENMKHSHLLLFASLNHRNSFFTAPISLRFMRKKDMSPYLKHRPYHPITWKRWSLHCLPRRSVQTDWILYLVCVLQIFLFL